MLAEEVYSMNTDESFNDETTKAMKSAYNDEDIIGPFDSIADLMEALNA